MNFLKSAAGNTTESTGDDFGTLGSNGNSRLAVTGSDAEAEKEEQAVAEHTSENSTSKPEERKGGGS